MERSRRQRRGFELLYPEPRKIAHRRFAFGTRNGQLDTTTLVNECYLKFSQRETPRPDDRAHLFGCSATVMRSIVVDAARAARTERRGSGADPVTLDRAVMSSVAVLDDEILDLHEALDGLAQVDPRLAHALRGRRPAARAGCLDEVALVLGQRLGRTQPDARRSARPAIA